MKRKKTVRMLIVVICFYLAFTTIQGTVALFSSGEKLTRREERLARLRKERDELLRKEKSVGRAEYLQKIAYEELGLSRPGEKVFIVPKELLVDNAPKAVTDKTPNWRKWADLLL